MHSTVSDGTDTPKELLEKVKSTRLGLFSLTDHDAYKGCLEIISALKPGDPRFITGVEFSCRDEDGKYHILGYNYDTEKPSIGRLVETGHRNRMMKIQWRMDFVKEAFGFTFSDEDVKWLLSLDNPGKPHLANMMVKYGYVTDKETAIREFIDKGKIKQLEVRPEDAINAILESGGIPVLAHPSYGSGEELILGDEMDKRLQKLIGYGLQGVEGFYSGFTFKLIREVLGFARKYHLYVTAGSDYHGTNKMIELGDNNLVHVAGSVPGLIRFMKKVL